MSEGELINNRSKIDDRDIFEKGYRNFSSKSINELFDVDNNGYVDAYEKDLMVSECVLDTLDSISPLVAHAFTQENFRLQTGAYLTERQRLSRDKLILSINKAILEEELNDIKDDIPQEINEERIKELVNEPISVEHLDTENLSEDIKYRQYLSQAEINNPV